VFRFVCLRNLYAFACLSIFVPITYSQETINNASLSGQVTDPSGSVVQDASVTATNTETGITQVLTTDRDGRFRFPYLRVGENTTSACDMPGSPMRPNR
jgi:Carboxypeptidase regulatory-like domain